MTTSATRRPADWRRPIRVIFAAWTPPRAVFFALGLPAWRCGPGDETDDVGADLPGTPGGATAALGAHRNPVGLVLAAVCFAVVVAIVVVGLYVMVASK